MATQELTLSGNKQSPDETKELTAEIDNILTADNIMDKVCLGIQRSSGQDILKRRSSLSGIESYCFVRGKSSTRGNFRIKLTESVIDRAGLTKQNVFKAARKNTLTCSQFSCIPMTSLLSEMTGMEEESFLSQDCLPMYVVSNTDRLYGAVQILNKKALSSWALEHGYKKLIVLPSSIHEVIVIPANSNCSDIDSLSEMVREVNRTQVLPHEQLSGRAYVLDLE